MSQTGQFTLSRILHKLNTKRAIPNAFGINWISGRGLSFTFIYIMLGKMIMCMQKKVWIIKRALPLGNAFFLFIFWIDMFVIQKFNLHISALIRLINSKTYCVFS